MQFIKALQKIPEFGKKYSIWTYKGYDPLEAYVTFNPFSRDETIGWLFKHPISGNLHWCEIMPTDLYEVE